MAKVISVVNKKGGCTKSSVSLNLADALSAKGHKVVIIDADSNRHCLKWFERSKLNDKYDCPFGVEPFSVLEDDSIQVLEGVDFIIADTAAQVTEEELTDVSRDSDFMLVPMMPSVDCYGPTLETVAEINGHCDYKILMSCCPSRAVDKDEFVAAMKEDGLKFFDTSIRQSVDISRASLQGTPVRSMKGGSRLAARDFKELAEELLEIIGE